VTGSRCFVAGLLCAGALGALSCTQPVAGNPVPPGAWSVRSAIPTPRVLLGAGVIGGKLYAVGGFVDSAGYSVGTAVLEVYDPQSDEWATKAPMPHASGDLAVGVVDGILYAVGGQQDPSYGTPTLNDLQAYDPATDSWTAKAPMPTARRALAVAVANGKLYAIGGNSDYASHALVATVEAYDPATDTWSTKAPMPTVRMLLAAATVNGSIYAVGGFDETSALAVVEAYDPGTDQWSTRSPMPGGVLAPAAASIGGVLYVTGGFTGISVTTTLAYDPRSDMWSAQAPMPSPRDGLAGGVIDSLFYVVAGQNEVSFDSITWSTANEVFSPAGTPASNVRVPPP
jgi:N-acetylneuraminic acid mutarotase